MSEFLEVGQTNSIGLEPAIVREWIKRGLLRSRDGLVAVEDIQALASGTSQPWAVLHAKPCGLTTVELFCGAGGLALGLHHAGLQPLMLVDVDADSIETIRSNRPDWRSARLSVADITLRRLAGTVDVMAGGFPCQAFSYAGHRLGFGDTRGTLFYEFARLVDEVRPRLVLGENVRGLLTHDGGRTLRTMVHELEALGYRVKYQVMRAQFLDVPQKRERLIIFALREDETGEIEFPEEHGRLVTLREALRNVPTSDGASYSPARRAVLDLVPEGGNWRDLPAAEQSAYMGNLDSLGGGATGFARRLAWDEPAPTLTCAPAQKKTERCHPSETRPLTVREYARVQTFPDAWAFCGSRSSRYRQIGNAVPVNLGFHLGIAARKMLGAQASATTLVKEEICPV